MSGERQLRERMLSHIEQGDCHSCGEDEPGPGCGFDVLRKTLAWLGRR